MSKQMIVGLLFFISIFTVCSKSYASSIESAFTVSVLEYAVNHTLTNNFDYKKIRLVSAEKLKILKKIEKKVMSATKLSIGGYLYADIKFYNDVPEIFVHAGDVKRCFCPFRAYVLKENGIYTVKNMDIAGLIPVDHPEYKNELKNLKKNWLDKFVN